MKHILIVFFFSASSTFSQNSWVNREITSLISVEFPGEPELIMEGLLKYIDSSAIYMCIYPAIPGMVDFQSNDKDLDIFYTSYIDKIVTKSSGVLEKRSSFKLKGYKGVEFTFSLTTPDGQLFKSAYKSIHTGAITYTLVYYTAKEDWETSAKSRNRYFKSLQISSRRIK